MPTGRRPPLLTLALVTLPAVLSGLIPATSAGAAGVNTHAWMAESAIDKVESADLRAILAAHPDHVRSGAMFPDAGYIVSGGWGEEAHWQRFIDNLTDLLVEKVDRDECGDITQVDGPCATLVAQLMGVLAHGIGDEVWDWLFEPNSPDRNEYYLHDDFGTFNSDGGAEMVMDVVAVGHYGRPMPTVPPLADPSIIIEAFERSGLHGVTPGDLQVEWLGQVAWSLVDGWSQNHLDPIMAAMPWMAANMITAPGGVEFGGEAIAGAWDSQWGRITGQRPTTRVSARYPADGERGVPATGWVRSYQPGSHPGRGGARTRIAASITYALPYVSGSGGPGVSNQLPAGSFTVTERDTGAVLPDLPGFPRAVPYGSDSGERMIALQPGIDLQPCTWYRVDVTSALLDADGSAVAPESWEFRTGTDAAGSPCSDDPSPPGLTGSVMLPTGGPAEGVLVLAYAEADGMLPTAGAITGPDGAYRIDDLPDGTYRLVFVPPAPLGLPMTWSGGTAARAGAEVLVHDGTTAWPAETLSGDPTTASITGTVRDADGIPLAGAAVQLFAPSDRWVSSIWVTTGEDGTYSAQSRAPGVYRARVVPPLDSGLGPVWVGGAQGSGVTLESDQTTVFDITYPAPG